MRSLGGDAFLGDRVVAVANGVTEDLGRDRLAFEASHAYAGEDKVECGEVLLAGLREYDQTI